jgi:hypothetical protein
VPRELPRSLAEVPTPELKFRLHITVTVTELKFRLHVTSGHTTSLGDPAFETSATVVVLRGCTLVRPRVERLVARNKKVRNSATIYLAHEFRRV